MIIIKRNTDFFGRQSKKSRDMCKGKGLGLLYKCRINKGMVCEG